MPLQNKYVRVDIHKETITWSVLFGFLFGAFIGEIMPEPTDFIYYWSEQQGLLANPWVATFVWYFLSASFYAVMFILAWYLYRTKRSKPEFVVFVIALSLIASTILCFKIVSPELSGTVANIIFLIVASGLAMWGLIHLAGYRISIKAKNGHNKR